MRIVLTGATGFVGGATLTRLLADEGVTAVTAVSRKPLTVEHPKLTVCLHQEFGAWDTTLLTGLAAHDACIWTLGAKASDVTDPDQYQRVTHDYTLAMAEGLAEYNAGHLRFCYLSGMGADPRENLRLPWERQTRTVKGLTERDLRALAARSLGFHVTSFRPGGILPTTTAPLARLLTSPISVSVADLAAAMITVGVGAAPGLPDVLHNRDIRHLSGAQHAKGGCCHRSGSSSPAAAPHGTPPTPSTPCPTTISLPSPATPTRPSAGCSSQAAACCSPLTRPTGSPMTATGRLLRSGCSAQSG